MSCIHKVDTVNHIAHHDKCEKLDAQLFAFNNKTSIQTDVEVITKLNNNRRKLFAQLSGGSIQCLYTVHTTSFW